MTNVIKGEFKKLEDLKVKDVSLTCDTSLEVFNDEFNQLSGMDDDLFTYEVEVANILSLKDSELKEQALRNKAIMEGLISDDESSNDSHELPVCNMRRFKMIKYSFRQDEEYVAITEDEYDDLEKTNDDACRAYQEIFRMMDEG
ncbi:hypothetical protein Tco_1509548 [Tanacetum coccineum]